MRILLTAAAAVTALVVPSVATAAPTITSAAVTGQATLVSGPSGRVWNTTVDSFYTLFIARPVTSYFNPNDNFSGAPVTDPDDGEFGFALNGDGFPTETRPNPPVPSDPFYRLTLTLTEGSRTGTLSGVYSSATGLFTATTPRLSFASGGYALTEFTWFRSNNNTVGAFSTNATPVIGPGSRADYQGSFTLVAVPEPATWALMILGFGVVGLTLRTRRRQQPIAAIA